jgi:cytochrome P450
VLSDPAPRPARSYDPTVAPYREDGTLHVHDHATVRALLRDSRKVTSDVSELVGPEQRVHPVSAFVWATDRLTLGGCPGRHAALRSAMGPWLGAEAVEQRRPDADALCRRHSARISGRPFDVYADYAEPLVVEYLAGWLGVAESDVRFAVADQLAAGEMFAAWPPPSTDELDEHYRELLARPGLRGVAAAARDLRDQQVVTEREAWGIVYALSVSAVATATAITLATGLGVEHGLWAGLADPALAGAAVEEAVRLGSPFPQASRFAREPFALGELAVEPGEQVLMWLTAANRDLPGPQKQPLDRFDPDRDTSAHLGWGSGYHACGGVRHARAVAETAVAGLARSCPTLTHAGPWVRFVGIDDGYSAAPAAP